MLNDQSFIDVTDYGAGSLSMTGNRRKIRDIVKRSIKPPRHAQLLFNIVDFIKPHRIVELGTSLGLTTSYLALVQSKAEVYTFEGCPQTAQKAKTLFKKLSIQNVTVVEGNLDLVLDDFFNDINRADLIYIDANHTYDATIRYFNSSIRICHELSVLILDDVYLTKEMNKAWETIKSHPDVQLTIDLFYFGIIFFRKNQPKQHFKLRI